VRAVVDAVVVVCRLQNLKIEDTAAKFEKGAKRI
jgi:hypothetical protein